MNSANGEASVGATTEASKSNQTSYRKKDMENFTSSTPSLATADSLTAVTPDAATALVPVFVGTMQGQSVQLCDARKLHTFMVVLRDFSNWIKGRIRKFGFVEGVDYLLAAGEVVAKSGENLGGRPAVDYHLTLDMAKELSMVENNAKGREARRYFIACEKQVQAALAVHPTDSITSTITPAQAQHLRELVQLVVASGKQSHAETWSRLHRKMHVNSYLMLRLDQFNEACQYLGGKFDDISIATLIQKHLPHAVPATPPKNALHTLPAPSLKNRRWLISFDKDGREVVQAVPMDAFVFSAAELPELILQSDSPFSASEVLQIAQYANMRMTNETGRLERNGEAARMKKAVLAMGMGDLAEIAKSAWMELAYRAAGPGVTTSMA